MFWETIAAILLLLGALPFWFFVSVAWGIIRAVLSIGGGFVLLLEGGNWEAGQFLMVAVAAVMDGFSSAWSVPAAIWDWAKYDHPWWASIIGLVLLGLGGSSNR